MKPLHAFKLAAAALFALSTATLVAAPAEPTLKVGDPAPKLQVGKWVQGEPVTGFKPGTAYIVEFWATWCGPCRASIPHLNEIYNRFKDKGLVVIGQDVWENNEAQVEPFIKKMGDKMTYRVALDDKNGSEKGKMADTWMEAAGQRGIPAAFLVDKQGKVVWIGHPMQLKDATIEAVLAGNYDFKKPDAEAKEQQQKLSKLSNQLSTAMREKDWDKAEATVNDIEKVLSEEQRAGLNYVRLQIALSKGDMAAVSTLAEKLSDATKSDAQAQNQLAWRLISSKGLSGAGLDTAAKIAERANTAAGGKDPAILDTLARATFLQGKKDQAIALQEKAVALAEGENKETLQKTLESYKAGKLPEAKE